MAKKELTTNISHPPLRQQGIINKVEKQSLNLFEENKKKLKELFPNIFDEKGNFDIERAKKVFSVIEEESNGKYEFNWNGKDNVYKILQTPTNLTLNPNKKESINFDTTESIFIEGDNLEVLKLLQKSYFNKIKMIYIDPPYNTGSDFIYKDNFRDNSRNYLEQTGQNKDGVKMTTNTETNGRYHSDWLTMMCPRLELARNLLKDDGIIFISIDDNEVHNLRMICNEIFGEENFIAKLVWKSIGGGGNDSRHFSIEHEYILSYAKNNKLCKIKGLEITNEKTYTLSDEYKSRRGKYYLRELLTGSRRYGDSLNYAINFPDGVSVKANEDEKKIKTWLWSKKKVEWGIKNGFIIKKKNKDNKWSVKYKQYRNVDNNDEIIERTFRPRGIIDNVKTASSTNELKNIFGENIFGYSKPYQLIQHLMQISTDKNDIILDFFAGSGTTCQAVMEQNLKDNRNRKYILVQLDEKTDENSQAYKKGYKTISQITKERIRRVIKKIKEEKKENYDKIDLGFKVFELNKSNYKIWEDIDSEDEQREQKLKSLIKLFENSLIDNWELDDVLNEAILKEGYDLNCRIEEIKIKENTFLKVSDEERFFILCLDKEIKEENIENLNLGKDNLFICLDESLTTSNKLNLDETLTLKVI